MRHLTDDQYNQLQLTRIQDGQRIFELEQEIGNLRSQLENGEQMYIAMRDRCAKVEAKMDALPADWQQDSSLETWFPLTAEELGIRKHDQRVLRYAVEQLISERDGDIGNIDDTLVESEMEVQSQEKLESK
jgi:hypothetical protein